MFIDFFDQFLSLTMPIAATDEPGFLLTFLSQLSLWGRVALGIGLVIFVHELGHFLAAKTFGVKCEKFYVGFDVPIKLGPIRLPRTLGKFTYGETEYGIGILPLGGYVKMLGQDDDPRKFEEEAKRIQTSSGDGDEEAPPELDPRSFPAKPVWQRMIIISAGVVMNLITGALFAALAFGYGVSYNPAIIGGVTPGGPAWRAGIEPGGRVVTVGNLTDDQMHFREMRMAILTEGLDHPEKPIELSIQYDDGVRNYKLRTEPHPENNDLRMIGITSPTSLVLSNESAAVPGSAADEALTEDDAGARIVAYDGIPVNPDLIVPSTPFFDYLYSHPEKTIELTVERADKSKRTVQLPPQRAKTIGFRYGLSPITSLTDDGSAAKAGMNVGDQIIAINGDSEIDAYRLPLELSSTTEAVTLTVRRGEGPEAKEVDIELNPETTLQTLSTTSGIGGDIAINRFGFAYSPTTRIVRVLPDLIGGNTASSDDELQVDDEIHEIRLVASEAELPPELKDERYDPLLEKLREGWTVDGSLPLGTLIETIQILPEGTPVQVLAIRPSNGHTIEATMAVQQDDRVWSERGLALTASESIQQADSFPAALSLGLREAGRRLSDVFRFLRMIPQGRVKMRHVGGPLEIVNIAKSEAERGISPQLLFLTMLSMNLAILNFLPIPALDGGHMVFLIAEAIRGKKLDEQLEMKLTMAGVLTILLLMVVVFTNDILRRL